MKPIGWEPGKKYPMILTIHGGPAGQFGFDWYHEFQVYASHGWAVFFTNPRGSTGYGEKFERGIQMQWGGNDYVDVMNGVDAVLAKTSWIDKARLGVGGRAGRSNRGARGPPFLTFPGRAGRLTPACQAGPILDRSLGGGQFAASDGKHKLHAVELRFPDGESDPR